MAMRAVETTARPQASGVKGLGSRGVHPLPEGQFHNQQPCCNRAGRLPPLPYTLLRPRPHLQVVKAATELQELIRNAAAGWSSAKPWIPANDTAELLAKVGAGSLQSGLSRRALGAHCGCFAVPSLGGAAHWACEEQVGSPAGQSMPCEAPAHSLPAVFQIQPCSTPYCDPLLTATPGPRVCLVAQ